jgi:cell division protein FtsZ
MTMSEIQEAAEVITSAVAPDANIIFGASLRPDLDDEVVITVVATGFDSDYYHGTPINNVAATFGADAEAAVEEAASQIDDDVTEEPAVVETPPEVSPEEVEAKREDFVNGEGDNPWEKLSDDDDSGLPAILRRRLKKKANKE